MGQYVAALLASRAAAVGTATASLLVDDATLEEGLVTGSLRLDTRLRDALRANSASSAGAGEQDSVISDSVAVRDADIVRLWRYLDLLAVRVGALGGRIGSRAVRIALTTVLGEVPGDLEQFLRFHRIAGVDVVLVGGAGEGSWGGG